MSHEVSFKAFAPTRLRFFSTKYPNNSLAITDEYVFSTTTFGLKGLNIPPPPSSIPPEWEGLVRKAFDRANKKPFHLAIKR